MVHFSTTINGVYKLACYKTGKILFKGFLFGKSESAPAANAPEVTEEKPAERDRNRNARQSQQQRNRNRRGRDRDERETTVHRSIIGVRSRL